MRLKLLLAGLTTSLLAAMLGCGGGGGSTNQGPAPSGNVHAIVSDDPTEDWATIGVKVLGISLVPQGGGTPVPIFTAPSPAPLINLVQLDQLGEIIGNASIPAGTYTAAQLTLGANNTGTACDITLTASGDPESGFGVPAGTTVPCGQMMILGAQGSAPNATVPLTINLATPLAVTASSTNALDLEFNLNHPAFIVEHNAVGDASPYWAVNFNGPLRHRPHPDLSKLLLRHLYGQVTTVATDGSSITVNRVFPVHPITSPETATASTISLPIQVDAANGTLLYDLDSGSDTPTTVTSFPATLANDYVRVAARYQQNGTLVATRVFASTSFDKVWRNPEGHVLHVNTTTNVMHVMTEDGKATALAIGPNTSFYFQNNPAVIGTGTAFFDGTTPGGLPNLARGFKVNATIDPLSSSTPPVALTVEIEIARYAGTITGSNSTDFTYTRKFAMADTRAGRDNYSGTLDYMTGSNTDQQGNAVQGFYWWNFTYPTLEHEGTNAVADFVNATDGSVNFGGTVGNLRVAGLSNSTWNDPAAANTWAAKWAILVPTGAPIGQISTACNTSTNSFAFTVPVPSGAPSGTPAAVPVTVDLSVASGSATLVYQVDRQGKVITITPQDITNATTLATVAGNLSVSVPVKVYGVPQSDGSIRAYMLLYYTHTASTE